MNNKTAKTASVEYTLPDINGDRCVHALIETASCQACVDICPRNAWILDDESLALDTSLCDACGLCVPVCSEGAITQTKKCTIREEKHKKVLLVACEYSHTDTSFESGENQWKCLHAISASELLMLYRDGIHQIFASRADCENCPRGNCEHLYERLGKINMMLRHSHLPPLHYNELGIDQWYRLWQTPKKAAPGPEMSRRMFFRSAIRRGVDMVLQQTSIDESQHDFRPLAKIISDLTDSGSDTGSGEAHPRAHSEELLFPAVPIINPANCTGCDTCVRACPHAALRFKLEENLAYYEIDASNCTSCHICTDLCEENAINILQWTSQTETSRTLCLNIQKCDSCGTVFHYPRLNPEDSPPRHLCNICEKVNHQKNLFQVLT